MMEENKMKREKKEDGVTMIALRLVGSLAVVPNAII